MIPGRWASCARCSYVSRRPRRRGRRWRSEHTSGLIGGQGADTEPTHRDSRAGRDGVFTVVPLDDGGLKATSAQKFIPLLLTSGKSPARL